MTHENLFDVVIIINPKEKKEYLERNAVDGKTNIITNIEGAHFYRIQRFEGANTKNLVVGKGSNEIEYDSEDIDEIQMNSGKLRVVLYKLKSYTTR